MKNLNLVVIAVTITNSSFALAQPNTTQTQQQSARPLGLTNIKAIRHVKIGETIIETAPARIGENEVLAPLLGGYSKAAMPLNAWLSRADTKYLPNSFSQDQSFQVNLLQGSPIILSVGKSKAFVNSEEYKLGAAPSIINGKIWLPVLSLASLIGAKVHNVDDSTLSLTVPEIKPVASIERIAPQRQKILPKGKQFNGMTIYTWPLRKRNPK